MQPQALCSPEETGAAAACTFSDAENNPQSKGKKDSEESIDGLQRQIEKTRTELEAIPLMYGFDNVGTAEKAYRSAKSALDTVKRKHAEWDGVTVQETKALTPEIKSVCLNSWQQNSWNYRNEKMAAAAGNAAEME